MSEFHENVRALLEDVHTFLQYTLRKEVLSTSCITLKDDLIGKLKHLSHEYPQLHLTISIPSIGTSSPQPYIDMQAKNVVTNQQISDEAESHYYDVTDGADDADDDEYEIVNPIKEEFTPAEIKTEFPEIEEEKEIVPVSASDLHNVLKSGFLEKKGKERLGGFFTGSQKRWCAIQNGILHYYDRPSDRRQKGQINLSGYETRPVTESSGKDNSTSKACFELVCPGRRTYQFIAVSIKDMKQWIAAIEESQAPFSTIMKNDLDLAKELDEDDDANDIDDIYESLEGNADVVEKSVESLVSSEPDYDEGLSLGVGKDEDLYADAESMLSQVMEVSKKFNQNFNHVDVPDCSNPPGHPDKNQTEVVVYVKGEGHVSNPNSWFISMWDCNGSSKNELDFKRGDLIRVISKQYDSYSWWIGEVDGRIGLLPKNYVTNAYEQVA